MLSLLASRQYREEALVPSKENGIDATTETRALTAAEVEERQLGR